jgi:hypothetical protein
MSPLQMGVDSNIGANIGFYRNSCMYLMLYF